MARLKAKKSYTKTLEEENQALLEKLDKRDMRLQNK